MLELNVKFQEQYKRLDTLCREVFSSKDGVTEYINAMEKVSFSRFCRVVYDWDIVYKQLKHLRWVRNQLAHEVGAFDDDLCTESDIEWLKAFHDSILNTKDPLSKVRQSMLVEKENQQRQTKQKNEVKENIQTENKQEETQVSIWKRIKAKIKEWFW